MKHLILVGACYLDTILSVPHYPQEDAKQRASSLEIRRGGNCPNSLEVLQQLVGPQDALCMHLVSPLPSSSSLATQHIKESFGESSPVDFECCLYRETHTQAASSYIFRSKQTGSRTIINYNDLPEMTVDEFEAVVRRFNPSEETWWHFEGRIPNTTLECVRKLRDKLPNAQISVEVEKPGRDGLRELAAEANVVFYSRSWAEIVHCPVESRAKSISVVDSVGAGDTFVAGMLYSLVCRDRSWDVSHGLRFAVHLATTKVQREGFQGLGAHVHDWLVGNAS
ncbi:pfkB family carbohydrate kinase domain-containing protein [Trichoderma breve]|uniref:PfkB family carbohydrate kinase domain-containing protein n=1 Tax=Trichoderma breve TaxID=2034170 RepID=A0A9W9B5I4_9HYPO|nr:pfkB family carbohydrate kinase domain-containing protein [Trichoderma breve]KAJ4856244.1 pfkB family carbohydrate kinase domain-containing protein [Trichoderma breve]